MEITVDEKIIDGCIEQQPKAQYVFYKLCYGFLMGICRRYANDKDTAATFLNNGMLKIFNGLKLRDTKIPLSLWMRRVMINSIIDEWRKEKTLREQTALMDNEMMNDADTSITLNDALHKLNAQEILLMIKELPSKSQRVFNLFAIDGFSHKEISAMLGMSEGTSKWHLNFARTELKKKLENISKEKILS